MAALSLTHFYDAKVRYFDCGLRILTQLFLEKSRGHDGQGQNGQSQSAYWGFRGNNIIIKNIFIIILLSM
jgi:hypothetical protein